MLVAGRTGVRRFRELPFRLWSGLPQWAPPLLAAEDRRPEPESGDVAAWLARRDGRPVGRVAASSDGRFRLFDCVDDPAVAGRRAAGVPARRGGGRAPRRLGRAGRHRPPWRPPTGGTALPPVEHDEPAIVAGYGDPALAVTDGDGVVVAAPDVSPALRAKGLRSAWSLARTARTRAWQGGTVVRCDGAVGARPGRLGAAAEAGYRWCLAPWSPDDRPPSVAHRLVLTA